MPELYWQSKKKPGKFLVKRHVSYRVISGFESQRQNDVYAISLNINVRFIILNERRKETFTDDCICMAAKVTVSGSISISRVDGCTSEPCR